MSELPDYLSEWITAQRWYSGKGRPADWQRLGGFELDDPLGEARITVHLLLDIAEPPLLYQVPLVERSTRLHGLEHALVGTFEAPRGAGTRWLYDGTHDPAGAAAILRFILDEGEARPDDGAPGIAARGHARGSEPLEIVRSRVLSGEQSNTSIIYEMQTLDGEAADPVICKLFRTVHHGENPDVTLLSAIAGSGSTVVPRSVGHITGQWRDTGEAAGFARGHLAFAQEFLPGVEDAWRVAVRAAELEEDFSARARTLGEATADIHLTLAAVLPTRAATEDDIAAVIVSMRARFDNAVSEVPSLEKYRQTALGVFMKAESAVWPALQRIHGDYHLGQVLSVANRGWVALDFEGEPMRPMRERTREDSPLRDVAGMLRSFDYVAGAVEQGALSEPHAGGNAGLWAADARRAFLEGYSTRSGIDLQSHAALLDAFELDKAVYEAVYEARNRPAWLGIPTAAIGRIIDRAESVGGQ